MLIYQPLLLRVPLEATSNEKSVENADRYLKRLKASLDIADSKDPTTVTDSWLAVALGYRNIYQAGYAFDGGKLLRSGSGTSRRA